VKRATLIVVTALAVVLAPLPGRAATEAPRCFAKSVWFPDAVTRLRGDVDGDGRSDLVRTKAHWLSDQTCRARLIVETARRALARRIDALTGLMIAPPGLAGLVNLDRRPGLEIATVVWQGASTGFVHVYGLRGAGLVKVNRETFDYAGSLVHLDGVDCVRKGPALVVDSGAIYRLSDNRYHVTRTFLGLRGGVLQPLPRLTEHHRVGVAGLNRFPELAAMRPFPSCTVVAGAP
jgi:hypothetical protein